MVKAASGNRPTRSTVCSVGETLGKWRWAWVQCSTEAFLPSGSTMFSLLQLLRTVLRTARVTCLKALKVLQALQVKKISLQRYCLSFKIQKSRETIKLVHFRKQCLEGIWSKTLPAHLWLTRNTEPLNENTLPDHSHKKLSWASDWSYWVSWAGVANTQRIGCVALSLPQVCFRLKQLDTHSYGK